MPKKEFLIEVHLRKIKFMVIPQMSYYPGIKTNPFTVFTSRNSTLGDLHVKITASMLAKSNKNQSVANLMNFSRIWKLNSA